ncbi:UNKNOWN [Stylonychia lemnae]|uniref:Amino acid transporter transmembrane domain-containing protein n=1 Tax=Stylonychia lemnae TaxID=5949 RepID=A0A077ZY82_STYLE|nr:UNKNOWN [Stylonychia lemnae]|eukprot:CDW74846.1 UNKNOWN [Stylonychia lemnae]
MNLLENFKISILLDQIDTEQRFKGKILKDQNSEVMAQIMSTYINSEPNVKYSSSLNTLFAFVATQLGIGILAMPCVILENGIVLGSVLIFAGGFLNYQTCSYIVEASIVTQKKKFEEISDAILGPSMNNFISMSILACLMTNLVSYICYVNNSVHAQYPKIQQKEEIPAIIVDLFGKENLPYILDDNQTGRLFWAAVFTVRFLIIIIYQVGDCISTLFAKKIECPKPYIIFRQQVPSPIESLSRASLFKFSINGAMNSFPMIFFSFCNQASIPMIYNEMKDKSVTKIKNIMILGTIISSLMFLSIGVFGYLIFIDDEEGIKKSNILLANFGESKSILLFLIICAVSPLYVLPSKETIEQLFIKRGRMSQLQNLMCTLGISIITLSLASFIPSIGDAIFIEGYTADPMTKVSSQSRR